MITPRSRPARAGAILATESGPLRQGPATEAGLLHISAPACGYDVGHWPVVWGRPAATRRARPVLGRTRPSGPVVGPVS